MATRILHNHVGHAAQIDRDLKAQLDGQPIKIGRKYVFALPTNGEKCIVVLNSRGFYHMYIPVAVYMGSDLLGYAFSEHAERAKDGAMVKKGFNIVYLDRLDDKHEQLLDLYNDNVERGIIFKIKVG